MRFVLLNLIATAGLSTILAQQTYQVRKPAPDVDPNSVPIYSITVTSRTISAVNFHHREGWTDLNLVGTALLPEGRGTVRVDSKTGATRVDVSVDHMRPAPTVGPEFLTYVLWAITPEGRPQNLGEVFIDENRHAKLSAATELQSFGLIVTAEPYYAVTQPSSAVVLEGVINRDTTGIIMPVEAKYELLERNFYQRQAASSAFGVVMDRRAPLDLREARYAHVIADAVGARHYAPDALEKARIDLQNAENLMGSRSPDIKQVQTLARHATQLFEDARLISIKKAKAEQEAATRAQAAEAERQAQTEAAARRTAEAERKRAQLEAANAQSAAEQAKLQEQQAQANAAADAERQAEEAKRQRAELREQLRKQFSTILETRETARGLILNMPNVLFEFDKADLKPEAREKLAKISGILLTYPELKIEADGHTDAIGTDEYNQKLSEARAESVRSYLAQEGVPADHLTSRGFGKTRPISTNTTAEGRQRNRRVELLVSGDTIASTGAPENQ